MEEAAGVPQKVEKKAEAKRRLDFLVASLTESSEKISTKMGK